MSNKPCAVNACSFCCQHAINIQKENLNKPPVDKAAEPAKIKRDMLIFFFFFVVRPLDV
jgi:hypothetical protein